MVVQAAVAFEVLGLAQTGEGTVELGDPGALEGVEHMTPLGLGGVDLVLDV